MACDSLSRFIAVLAPAPSAPVAFAQEEVALSLHPMVQRTPQLNVPAGPITLHAVTDTMQVVQNVHMGTPKLEKAGRAVVTAVTSSSYIAIA